MYKQSITLLFFSIIAVASAYISSIAVDTQSGQIFVTEYNNNPVLYELDNVAVTQNNVHYIQGLNTTNLEELDSNSLFVKKQGTNKRVLYTFISTTGEGLQLASFKLPFKNEETLHYTGLLTTGSLGASLDPSYDTSSSYVVSSPSRNITLSDTATMTVLGSFRIWGTRWFGRNAFWNNVNKHLMVFFSAVPYRGAYGLSVEEYAFVNGSLQEVPTTYNCLCDPESGYVTEQSPFYQVVLDSQSCKVNYITSRIWCSDSSLGRIYSFQATNLSDFTYYNTSVAFDQVEWDFVHNKVYAVKETSAGFDVHKLELVGGAVVMSKNITGLFVDSYVMTLDTDQPHLYIAAANTNVSSIVYVNTNTLAPKLVTLNKKDLN